jgi:hypothetical protein
MQLTMRAAIQSGQELSPEVLAALLAGMLVYPLLSE